MPTNPSNQMLSRIFGNPQPIKKGKIQEGPQENYALKSIMPSWMRDTLGTGLEGAANMTQGILGMGDDSSKMNLIGQMIPTALGALGMAGKTGIFGKTISNNPNTYSGTVKDTANKLSSSGSPIYDEAGRFLGMGSKPDPAYLAHVASSRNKNIVSSKKALSPSDAKYEMMMQGNWRNKK